MKTRVITAVVALILFLPLLFLGGEYFKYTTYFLGILAMFEVIKMTFGKENLPMLIFTGLLGTIVYIYNKFNLPSEKYVIYCIGFVMIICLLATIVTSGHSISFTKVATVIFLAFYIYVGFYSLYVLRDLSLAHVFYLLLTIWVTDSLAYIGGSKFGKNKLAPAISPNKSIEGSVIGSLSSIVVALGFYFTTSIFSNLVVAILVTLVVSVVGQFGDLIESAYKRECKVKDSSNLLPGHGGIFDRFDSVILAAPCLVLLLNLILLVV